MAPAARCCLLPPPRAPLRYHPERASPGTAAPARSSRAAGLGPAISGQAAACAGPRCARCHRQNLCAFVCACACVCMRPRACVPARLSAASAGPRCAQCHHQTLSAVVCACVCPCTCTHTQRWSLTRACWAPPHTFARATAPAHAHSLCTDFQLSQSSRGRRGKAKTNTQTTTQNSAQTTSDKPPG